MQKNIKNNKKLTEMQNRYCKNASFLSKMWQKWLNLHSFHKSVQKSGRSRPVSLFSQGWRK